ncbi:serine hydrolase [Streptococcus sp. NLN76]|uniref:serine hydrolase n=1 Tax=Streptococcus sp. NLN76 TaxID=2822800 RepID=UPI0018A9D626|nr:serine hydrolase [Streptococcus sp. NLN76]MBF8970068.1 serine hydrolase [Streptococcus sp. NLN76]
MKKNIKWIVGSLVALASVAFIAAVFFASTNSNANPFSEMVKQITGQKAEEKKEEEPKEDVVRPTNKSQSDKQRVMEEDVATMNSYGLYYDYANLSLEDVVKAYMDEYGIDYSQVAFSYKNTKSNETFAFNDTQAMTAGSTYKLPLNMLVVDEVDKGNLSLEEEFDITNTQYEYQGEHDNYVAAFGGAMTIPDMQVYSLVYSENTPAYALADRLGGMDKVYTMYDRYGTSKGEIKTISTENKTTTDYFIQVLDYLWKNQKKYAEILRLTGESFPGEYYKGLLPGLKIDQKPGYVNEALNVNAVVYEETPYLVALYTAGLGGSTVASTEVNPVGLYQVSQLAYVINEWHRVNMNP